MDETQADDEQTWIDSLLRVDRDNAATTNTHGMSIEYTIADGRGKGSIHRCAILL